jgi:hypothetical protein
MMLGFLRRIFERAPLVEMPSGIPVSQTEGGKLFRTIMRDICPDCKAKGGFYQGPQGGLSTNIFCRNRECRQASMSHRRSNMPSASINLTLIDTPPTRPSPARSPHVSQIE